MEALTVATVESIQVSLLAATAALGAVAAAVTTAAAAAATVAAAAAVIPMIPLILLMAAAAARISTLHFPTWSKKLALEPATDSLISTRRCSVSRDRLPITLSRSLECMT
jgi:hypothetical protein